MIRNGWLEDKINFLNCLKDFYEHFEKKEYEELMNLFLQSLHEHPDYQIEPYLLKVISEYPQIFDFEDLIKIFNEYIESKNKTSIKIFAHYFPIILNSLSLKVPMDFQNNLDFLLNLHLKLMQRMLRESLTSVSDQIVESLQISFERFLFNKLRLYPAQKLLETFIPHFLKSLRLFSFCHYKPLAKMIVDFMRKRLGSKARNQLFQRIRSDFFFSNVYKLRLFFCIFLNQYCKNFTSALILLYVYKDIIDLTKDTVCNVKTLSITCLKNLYKKLLASKTDYSHHITKALNPLTQDSDKVVMEKSKNLLKDILTGKYENEITLKKYKEKEELLLKEEEYMAQNEKKIVKSITHRGSAIFGENEFPMRGKN